MEINQRRVDQQIDTIRGDVNEIRAGMNDLKREVASILDFLRRNNAAR